MNVLNRSQKLILPGLSPGLWPCGSSQMLKYTHLSNHALYGQETVTEDEDLDMFLALRPLSTSSC